MLDVIVVGLGAVGSAALYQLARRGATALGIDRFRPPHDRGSSHGDTRITRLALGEGDRYLPLARRSHAIWRELEAATGETLFEPVGCLVLGPASGRSAAHGATDFLASTLAVARRHGVAHEALDAAALARRFPQFRWRGDEQGCFEPGAGFVRPERCIAAQLAAARRLGAEIRTDARVAGWAATADGVRVTTEHGVRAGKALILAAGAWIAELVPELAARVRVFRQVLFWFEADGSRDLFVPDRMPVFIRIGGAGEGMVYGFPAVDGPLGGLKIASEQFEASSGPDGVDPRVGPEEVEAMHALAAPHLRITPRCLRSAVCMYTVTRDFHFVVGRHPASPSVWLASACSGHGFKHAAALGEALAEQVLLGRSAIDLAPFGGV
jgi:sarcosine oxidase